MSQISVIHISRLSGKLVGTSMRSKDLAKASGLDLRQPQGAQVGDLVRPGESEQEPNRASKRANSFSIK